MRRINWEPFDILMLVCLLLSLVGMLWFEKWQQDKFILIPIDLDPVNVAPSELSPPELGRVNNIGIK